MKRFRSEVLNSSVLEEATIRGLEELANETSRMLYGNIMTEQSTEVSYFKVVIQDWLCKIK